MRPTIWCPMKSEAKAIESEIHGSDISLFVSGVGRKKSLDWAGSLTIKERADIGPLFIVGYGGALDPHLNMGDIFLADEIIVSARGTDSGAIRKKLPGAGELKEKLGIKDIQTGAVYSSLRPVLSSKKRLELNGLGARVVDMESWWLTQNLDEDLLARTAVLRVVSDTKAGDIMNLKEHIQIANEGLKQVTEAIVENF